MCFSAEADLVAGLAVGAVGIDALRHVARRAELPLASIPLVLGAHQLIEAFVWLGLQGDVSHDVGRRALWLYLIIAFAVLPVLVPVALSLLEPAFRRRLMMCFGALGLVVATALTTGVVRGPIVAVVQERHIDYRVELWQGNLLVALYVVATCGPLLISSRRRLRWFGAVNVVAVATLALLASRALVSLWCLWAAATSTAIAVHLRVSHRQQQTAPKPAPVRPIG